jgi:hypothetical protein
VEHELVCSRQIRFHPHSTHQSPQPKRDAKNGPIARFVPRSAKEVRGMNPKSSITFAALRRLLEKVGYRHEHYKRGEIFHLSEERELYYRPYQDRDYVNARDIAKTRSFLDDWGQLKAADFDAFLESTTKPA